MHPMSSLHQPSPQERLANSRKALVRHMTHEDRPTAGEAAQPHEISDDGGEAADRSGFWASALARAVQTWWRKQPASVAFSVAKPVLGRYAERQPFKLLGIAAVAGAAVVLIRPWRLVSVGGLVLAAVKSAAVPGVLMSLFATRADGKPASNPHEPSPSSPYQPTEAP